MPNILKDLTGDRFGSLTVTARAAGTHEAKWLCKCDCGIERVYVGGKLRRGVTKCKCDGGKDRDGLAKANVALYSVWSNMKDRCYRKLSTGYENYGGRGVGVCAAWKSKEAARSRVTSHSHKEKPWPAL